MKRYLILLFCVTGCNLAPRYETPEVAIPTTWRVLGEDMLASANLSWWQQLGDATLDALIQEGIDHNKDIQIAAWRVREYFANYQIALSAFFPQVSASGNALKERLAIDADFLPPGFSAITPDYNLKTSVSFEFDFWCKTKNASSSAFLHYLAEIENRRIVVLSLVASIVQSYVVLRELDAKLELASCIVQSKCQALELATMLWQGGETSQLEVEQARSLYEESLASLHKLQEMVPKQENYLSLLLGRPPGSIERGKTLSALHLQQDIPIGTPADLLVQRPDIRKAEELLRAACANIGVARAAFFPQINLGALYGADNLQLYKLFHKESEIWMLGGSFLQTLFSGGALLGQVRMTEAQQKELLFSYEQTVLTALKEVNDDLIGLAETKKILQDKTEQVDALRTFAELIGDRYLQGQADYQSVLAAKTRLFTAQEDLAHAQAEPFLMLVELYKALGGGWVIEEDQKIHIEE